MLVIPLKLRYGADDKKYFREAVRLGFPGDTTAEKMKNCIFTLEKGEADGERVRAVTALQNHCIIIFACNIIGEAKGVCAQICHSVFRNGSDKYGGHWEEGGRLINLPPDMATFVIIN